MTVALNNREAHAVNTLLDYVLKLDRQPTGTVSTCEARAAAQLLAEKAYKQLYAGVRPGDVDAHWPRQDQAEPPAADPGGAVQ